MTLVPSFINSLQPTLPPDSASCNGIEATPMLSFMILTLKLSLIGSNPFAKHQHLFPGKFRPDACLPSLLDECWQTIVFAPNDLG
jgi:hypothetical protein